MSEPAQAQAAALVAPSEADESPLRPTLGARLKHLVLAPVRIFAAVFLPDKTLRQEVTAGRWGAAFLCVLLCGAFGALAVGSRLDVSTDVLKQASMGGGMEMGGGGGGGRDSAGTVAMSDREIQEQISKEQSVARVMLVLKADALRPLLMLILMLAAFVITSYVGGKPTMRRVASAVSHAAVPLGIQAVVVGIAALSQASLTPSQADELIANPIASWAGGLGAVGRLFAGVSPFTLWAVVLLALGLAAAASISRVRAAVTTVVSFALFLGLTNVVCSPPPQDGGGMHGQHGPRG